MAIPPRPLRKDDNRETVRTSPQRERVARFLCLTSSVSSPVTSPLMKIKKLDRGVADDNLRTVSLGIKKEDYINRDNGDEEQCDDAEEDDDYDELISRTVKVKRDRIRKLGRKEFTKRGCVYTKFGLGVLFRC